MATLTPGAMTYAEWGLRHDATGKLSTLVNLLSQANGMLDDMVAVECQSGNAFEYTQVVGLPTPSRRVYNQGVARTMASVAKQVAVCKQYADWAVVDKDLADLGGNVKELRAAEVALHMQAMGQKVAYDLFYGNAATDPNQFTGFSNIYNTVSTGTSLIAGNVIDCGGTGSDNCSMWLVTWGPKTIHTLFPKGVMGGLQHIDYGDAVPLADSSGYEYPGYRDYLSWKIGLAIHDWRYAVRACNIDVSDLNTGSAANLITAMAKMVHRLPIQPVGVGPVQTSDSAPDQLTSGFSAFYVNRTILEYLDIQAANKTNVLLRMVEWDGHPILTYRGVPIRCSDALLNSETRVT